MLRSSEWRLTCTVQNFWDSSTQEEIPFTQALLANERVLARAEYASYGCDIKIFNEKEVATGLRDVEVVFVDYSGTTLKPSRAPQAVDSRNVAVDSDVINLPP